MTELTTSGGTYFNRFFNFATREYQVLSQLMLVWTVLIKSAHISKPSFTNEFCLFIKVFILPCVIKSTIDIVTAFPPFRPPASWSHEIYRMLMMADVVAIYAFSF